MTLEFERFGLALTSPERRELFSGFSCLKPAAWRAGELIILAGPSGCGKSSLLRYLMGLSTGSIEVSGAVHCDPSDARKGLVFQQGALFDDFSVSDNLAFGSDHAPAVAQDHDQWKERHKHLLATPVPRLSGGQQRLVALERTRRFQAQIVLFDEPTVGLDPQAASNVAEEIRQAADQSLVIVITHELHYFKTRPQNCRQRVFLFERGQILEQPLPPEEAAFAQAMEGIIQKMRDGIGLPAQPPQPKESTWLRDWVRREPWTWPWQPLARLLLLPLGQSLYQQLWGGIKGLGRTRLRWHWSFLWRVLARAWASFPALAYFALMGGLFGFTLGYAILKYFPEKNYSLPVVFDRLAAGYTMGLYRVVIPLFVSILFAARSGAAVAADLGNRVVAQQVEAMRSFGINPSSYLVLPVYLAFLPGLLVLQELTFATAWLGFAVAYLIIEPEPLTVGLRVFALRDLPDYFTWLHPFSWTWLKLLLTGIVLAGYVCWCGLRPKASSQAVSSDAIHSVLLSTIAIVVITFVFVLVEF